MQPDARTKAMNPRQAYALAHPMNRAFGDMTPFRTIQPLADKTVVVVILAVDR